MNYPNETATILLWMGYKIPDDFTAEYDGTTITLNWHPANNAPKPTPEEITEQALPWSKSVRIRALEIEKEAYVRTLYSDQVVQDAALGSPSVAFRDQVIADRTQCSADLATAIAAVEAATSPADALAVQITWAVTR